MLQKLKLISFALTLFIVFGSLGNTWFAMAANVQWQNETLGYSNNGKYPDWNIGFETTEEINAIATNNGANAEASTTAYSGRFSLMVQPASAESRYAITTLPIHFSRYAKEVIVSLYVKPEAGVASMTFSTAIQPDGQPIALKTLYADTDYTCGIWQEVQIPVSQSTLDGRADGSSLAGIYIQSSSIGKSIYIDHITSKENFSFTKMVELSPDRENTNYLVMENGGLTYRKNMNGEYNVLPVVNVQSLDVANNLVNGITISNQNSMINNELPPAVTQEVPKIEESILAKYSNIIPEKSRIGTEKPEWNGSFQWNTSPYSMQNFQVSTDSISYDNSKMLLLEGEMTAASVSYGAGLNIKLTDATGNTVYYTGDVKMDVSSSLPTRSFYIVIPRIPNVNQITLRLESMLTARLTSIALYQVDENFSVDTLLVEKQRLISYAPNSNTTPTQHIEVASHGTPSPRLLEAKDLEDEGEGGFGASGELEFIPLVTGTHYVWLMPKDRLHGYSGQIQVKCENNSNEQEIPFTAHGAFVAFTATKGVKHKIKISPSTLYQATQQLSTTYRDYRAKIYAIIPGAASAVDELNRMSINTAYTVKSPIKKLAYSFASEYVENGVTYAKYNTSVTTESVPSAYSSYKAVRFDTSLDGRYVYFAQEKSSSILCYDRVEKKTTTVYTAPLVDMKTNTDGSLLAMLVYENGAYRLMLYSRESGKTTKIDMASIDTSSFSKVFLTNDALYFTETGKIYRTEADQPREQIHTCGNDESLVAVTESVDNRYVVYSLSTGATILLTKTVSYAAESISTATGIFGKTPHVMYVDGIAYDVKTKTSRSMAAGTLLGVLEDDRLLMKDSDTKFFIYNPVNDEKITFEIPDVSVGNNFYMAYDSANDAVIYVDTNGLFREKKLDTGKTVDRYLIGLEGDKSWYAYSGGTWQVVDKADKPSIDKIKIYGMTASEVNHIASEALEKLQENRDLNGMKIAVYFNSNSNKVVPKINQITVDYTSVAEELGSKTIWGFLKTPLESTKSRKINSIRPVETFTEGAQILYFLQVGQTIYGFRENIKVQLGSESDFYAANATSSALSIEVQKYGMSADEFCKMNMLAFEEAFQPYATADLGIFAVIVSRDGVLQDIDITYNIDRLADRFSETAAVLTITMTDDTVIKFTSADITHEQIECFIDWLEDRKHNRGPVFYIFESNGTYQLVNYYMIKTVSVS